MKNVANLSLCDAVELDNSYSNKLIFWINGEKVEIENADPTILLSDYLHDHGLTGTKVACGQGGCGACTVMISQKDQTGKAVHRPINSCLRPICSLDGMMVTTTEGIGNVRDGLDPTQYSLAINNGSQCGFCTPGFVMNAHAYLQEHPKATEQEIEDIFGGNFCRCTGYRPILQGLRTLACDFKGECQQKCLVDPAFDVKHNEKLKEVNLGELPAHNLPPRQLYFHGAGHEWFRPNNLAELFRLKKLLVEKAGKENVKLVFGNTAAGIYSTEKPRYLIDIASIRELTGLDEGDDGITIGATTTIQHLLEFAKSVKEKRSRDQVKGLEALIYHGQFIAGLQVRAAGSVAGNIFITRDHGVKGGAFPSDLFTAMATLGATVTIGSNSFEGSSKTFELIDLPPTEALPPDAVILSFHIPFTKANEYVQTYRIARRKQMAHPIVNAGFRCRIGNDGKVEPGQVTVIYGGLAQMIYRAGKTEQALIGQSWTKDTLAKALEVLTKEVKDCTIPMAEEGLTNEYRMQLAENFFYRFFLHVSTKLDPKSVDERNLAAAEHDIRPLSTGRQEFDEYPELYPLTKPYIKRAAFVQTSGEIRYTQDIDLPYGGFHAVMVKSIRPHARFSYTKNVDGLDKLCALLKKQFPGFKDLVTVADVPKGGENLIGLGDDDPVFSDGIVTCVHAPIALVLADTIPTARAAAEFVQNECIAYEDLQAVITLKDAIEKNTAMPMKLRSSDPDADVLQRIPTISRIGSDMEWCANPKGVKLPDTELAWGTIRTPAQAHFYLETNCALAIPCQYDQMTIYSSTQSPNETQCQVAKSLGVKANQIQVLVEQIGGGFGAKQHRANIVAAQAAVAARKINKPIRLLYDRATDTQMIGKRHPYEADYHVAYSDDGKIHGLRLDIRSDAGDTYDATFAVLDLGLLTSDACYMVPNLQTNGTAYRTNKQSNTAFRTFGVVQVFILVETVIERVAFELSKKLGKKILPEDIREKNMYKDGTPGSYDSTHFGQELEFSIIRELFDALKESSEFERREKEVEEFNKKNRWHKRGICLVPHKHGIAFTEPRGSLNAASALVNVNMTDGSVIIYHGGVEMGQGLHTKIAQLAANTLGIPLEFIRIGGNNTDSILNCPATAASTGYDLNGGAVELACRRLRERLENFCRDIEQFNPHSCIDEWRTKWSEKWQEIIFKAWFNRINLSSAELYKSPHYKGPTYKNPQGKPFLYFGTGVSCVEVEIDVLTGEFKTIRADVLGDNCKSPNPAIDIGQLEGGFVQGLGFATTEEVIYDHDGRLVTDNIWSYKPPCTKTIPLDFRIRLHPVNEERNTKERLAEMQAVKSSKALTECSLSLGAVVYFALIHAIKEARKEMTGTNEWIDMDLPMTCQQIQRLCKVSTSNLKL